MRPGSLRVVKWTILILLSCAHYRITFCSWPAIACTIVHLNFAAKLSCTCAHTLAITVCAHTIILYFLNIALFRISLNFIDTIRYPENRLTCTRVFILPSLCMEVLDVNSINFSVSITKLRRIRSVRTAETYWSNWLFSDNN